MIELEGQELAPCGEWDEVCEYTDDDVHYLEIEQPWTSDVLLQRQILVIREDRCVLLADAVLPEHRVEETVDLTARVRLASRVLARVEQFLAHIYSPWLKNARPVNVLKVDPTLGDGWGGQVTPPPVDDDATPQPVSGKGDR